MLILGVDTTRDRLVAVLSDEYKTYYKVSDEGNKKHTSKLLPVIDELLSENGFTLDDVAAFSAVTGPGSFTGIRVGVSTINALSICILPSAAASFDSFAYMIFLFAIRFLTFAD